MYYWTVHAIRSFRRSRFFLCWVWADSKGGRKPLAHGWVGLGLSCSPPPAAKGVRAWGSAAFAKCPQHRDTSPALCAPESPALCSLSDLKTQQKRRRTTWKPACALSSLRPCCLASFLLVGNSKGVAMSVLLSKDSRKAKGAGLPGSVTLTSRNCPGTCLNWP